MTKKQLSKDAQKIRDKALGRTGHRTRSLVVAGFAGLVGGLVTGYLLADIVDDVLSSGVSLPQIPSPAGVKDDTPEL